MYIIMSETFIKIDLLQHLEISRQTYPKLYRNTLIQMSYYFLQYNSNFSKC